jgi:hypothetical protein
VLLSSGQMSFAQTLVDINAFFQKASGRGGEGLARKTKTVDVREATPGEVVATSSKGKARKRIADPSKQATWWFAIGVLKAETRNSSSPLRNSSADTTGRRDPRPRAAGVHIGRAARICASSW